MQEKVPRRSDVTWKTRTLAKSQKAKIFQQYLALMVPSNTQVDILLVYLFKMYLVLKNESSLGYLINDLPMKE